MKHDQQNIKKDPENLFGNLKNSLKNLERPWILSHENSACNTYLKGNTLLGLSNETLYYKSTQCAIYLKVRQ